MNEVMTASIWGNKAPLYHMPSVLTGHYFKEVTT